MGRKICTPAAAPAETRASSTPFRLEGRRRPADYLGNDEPPLEELLSDEVILRVMSRDGVRPEQVMALASHLGGR